MSDLQPPSLRQWLFDPSGRVNRRAWWLWGVAMPLGMLLYLTVVLRVIGLSARATDIAVNLLLVWPAVVISIKRWHDRDKSGWWVLVSLIPVIGWLWALIENGLLRGDAQPNRFGPPSTPPMQARSIEST
jgi:uncharacterized membrane protein YhaH (DUF805 family)